MSRRLGVFLVLIVSTTFNDCHNGCTYGAPTISPVSKSSHPEPNDLQRENPRSTSATDNESASFASSSASSSMTDSMTFHFQLQNIILRTQTNLLRVIGLVDKSWEGFGEVLRNTTFQIVLDGQKAFAKSYDSLPQFVNRLIQRVGTLFGSSGDQLNQILNTSRNNLKAFMDNWEEHEHDLHHVQQQTFKTVNSHLGVPPLPDYKFTWYK